MYLFAIAVGAIVGFLVTIVGTIEMIESHANTKQPIQLKSGKYSVLKIE